MRIDKILSNIVAIEHGFQHIHDGAEKIFSTHSKEQCFELAFELFKHEAYQTRMLATTILGRLAVTNNDALRFLKERVSTDENWRVQEMLAKAFDEVCKCRGYETSLPLIDEWLKKWNNLEEFTDTEKKLEWQAGKDIETIWDGLIQIRPSGVRVKRPTSFPALVAMVQIPIIGKYKRRLTPREASRLQSFPENFMIDENDFQAYKQFGNSVNVKCIEFLAKQLFEQTSENKKQ